MSGLPRGWVEARLHEVANKITDGSHNPPPGQTTGVPMLSAKNIRDGLIWFDDFRRISPQEFEIENRRSNLSAGDVLMTIVGAIGRAAVVRTNEPFALQRSVAIIGDLLGLLPDYLAKHAMGPVYQEWLFDNAKGTAQKGVYLGKLAESPIAVPPLAEQKRIVAKLDALNAKSARARTELARIETLVSRYKQAVLSKAFSGELTSAADSEARPGDNVGNPLHWRQMHLGEIADIKSGITLGKKRKQGEQLLSLPYLRVANVQRGWLDLSEIKTVEVTAKEAEALFLREGDVLMNEGGDRDKLGRGWVWDGQIADCIHQNHVFRVRLKPGTVPPRFLSYYANEFGQKHFFDEGKQTTNLASISKSKLSEMKVPAPPFEEAEEIVRRIESAFARIDLVAGQAKRSLELVGKLDEAILAKAFRGELVPQNENDEPARVLLDRIRQTRAAEPVTAKAHRPKRQGKVPHMTQTIVEALNAAKDWLSAQELFERCGVQDGSSTEDVERLYRQLLDLERQEKIEIEEVIDRSTGAKKGDRVRLRK